MLTRVDLKNYGPLRNLIWENLGPINLIIGGNGSGKTFLLKALYTAIKSLEEYRRGNDPRELEELLTEKLYWTFQIEKLGNLATKNSEGLLICKVVLDSDECLKYLISRNSIRKITVAKSKHRPRDQNSVFLPAKEVLSLHKIILKTRDQDKLFGFDDTYLDLAHALIIPRQKGKNFSEFAKCRKNLEEIIDGKVLYDEKSEQWEYKQGNSRFPIGVTAEGIKKIAILDTLLGNRYLSRGSIIFIDEPESALHPTAVSKFLDIIATLAHGGIQFFVASHSYFVIKKLYLIALEKQISIPLLSAEGNSWQSFDLLDGMPENEIIDESIRLYREEVGLALT